MRLETVRTVLSNDVNEVSVCVDLKRRSGVFYTVVSIYSADVRKKIASLIATANLFANNHDFIGSYTQGDSLNLVFLYRNEATFERHESIYATSFSVRKQIAEKMMVSLAETQLTGSIGLLLLDSRNVNIAPDLSIYYNYFLDFAQWKEEKSETDFYMECAQLVFRVISAEYEVRYANVDEYPSELQAFYKKTRAKSFTSFSSILTFLRMIPDTPSELAVGVRKVVGTAQGFVGWFRRHSMLLFVCFLLLITLAYAGYQITTRVRYRRALEQNTTYEGLGTIGEVSLGDETI